MLMGSVDEVPEFLYTRMPILTNRMYIYLYKFSMSKSFLVRLMRHCLSHRQAKYSDQTDLFFDTHIFVLSRHLQGIWYYIVVLSKLVSKDVINKHFVTPNSSFGQTRHIFSILFWTIVRPLLTTFYLTNSPVCSF